MQINTNVPENTIWKNDSSSAAGLRSSMSKLALESRTAIGGDDSAGVAMSDRLETQSRHAAATAGRIENNMSYLQTADSWLQEMDAVMGRMSELATVASEGETAESGQDSLQKEFLQMQQEIQHITSGSTAAGTFNGAHLFRGGNGVAEMSDAAGLGSMGPEVGALALSFDSDELNLSVTNDAVIGSYVSESNQQPMRVKWNELIAGDGLNISTQAGAKEAVGKLQVGMEFLGDKLAVVDAEMERMDHTLEGLNNFEENIRAAESRIRDVGEAKVTTTESAYQIRQDAGAAMLAQANQRPSGVIQLLGS